MNGPPFIGIDTHALSVLARATALEVLAASGVKTMVDEHGAYTPTPVISYAILCDNRGRTSGLADGVVVTPSHNPPADGGFKYSGPNGGPADTDIMSWIARTVNELLEQKLAGVKRAPAERSPHIHRYDFITPYVSDLANVVDMDAIHASGVTIGIDPLGGAAVRYWQPLIERYGLAATVVNQTVDPTFRFMTADWVGKIRMDCSSPYAMTGLIGMRDWFDVAFANDTDADRHGIVTRSVGLMNPNNYLAVAIDYLWRHRPDWSATCGVGKTVVSSTLIDRVAARLGRKLVEVPIGRKWFAAGLTDGSPGFGGEESAGAPFLCRDGPVWTTDKDGLILGLLAAEITARTNKDLGQRYVDITKDLGEPCYERIDAPATLEQRRLLAKLSPERASITELAGEPVQATLPSAASRLSQPAAGSRLGRQGPRMFTRSTRKVFATRTIRTGFSSRHKRQSAAPLSMGPLIAVHCQPLFDHRRCIRRGP